MRDFIKWSLILVSAVLASQINAAEAPRDISKEISALRGTIVSAEVMLVPRGMTSFRFRLSEKDLPGNSCTYEVSDKKDLDSLIDTLAAAGIVEAEDPARKVDARIGVFLHTSTGEVIRLMTGPDYSNAAPFGMFNRATTVLAQKGFETDMRIWAAQRKPTRMSYICEVVS
jgi:hypothetical protein